MIEVNDVIAWSATERHAYQELAVREINVATRDLRRSVDFYSRVFGFRTLGDHGGGAPVILSATARADLVIHEVHGAVCQPGIFARSWGFIVANLDLVREVVWDLGIRVVRDSGAPDQIYRWANGRSLYIGVPDGHEIELVEIWNGACAGTNARRSLQGWYGAELEREQLPRISAYL